MTPDKRNRVFWLGHHIVLTKTELPRLRALGFEVFNPPYLSDLYDQSAVIEWDRSQRTTLPPEVFEELSRYNFFYNRISPRIAELLNEYFGTVIVTCAPVWLHAILAAFRGRVIYRVFGQIQPLSETLCDMQLFRSIQEREGFFFVPHSEEAVRDEHAWLKTRMTVVPYTIPLDVFGYEGTWSPSSPHDREIMACCPNIENPYYCDQYGYLNTHFPESYIKLYGVQPRRFDDPRVVGTLPREEQLSRYRRSAGFWYHYDDPGVCYLPPIEMMTVGGPVVYMRGSLLARYFRCAGPGEAVNVDDARRKLQLLLAGDRAFVDELRDAQRSVVRRYHPDYVHPVFDRAFQEMINRPDVPRQEPLIFPAARLPRSRKQVVVFLHAPGQHVIYQDGAYRAADDLARTAGKVTSALLEDTDHDVVVTCLADQLQFLFGYLNADRFPGRLLFCVLDQERLAPVSFERFEAPMRPSPTPAVDRPETGPTCGPQPMGRAMVAAPATNWRQLAASRFRRIALTSLALVGRSRIAVAMLALAAFTAVQLVRKARCAKAWLVDRKMQMRHQLKLAWWALKSTNAYVRRRDCVDRLNREKDETLVIVPHGHLFPEAVFLTQPLVLCLPEILSASSQPQSLGGKLKAQIARCLAEKAVAVCTDSEISQSRALATRLPVGFQRGGVRAPHAAGCQSTVNAKPHAASSASGSYTSK